MPTTVVSTLGSGGDYTTLQAWEDAAPANLVTSDQVWEGRILAGTNFFTTLTTPFLGVAGSTTDATRYKFLTADAGASFVDHVDALTNPLRFDSSKGVSINSQAAYSRVIDCEEDYFRISKLQVLGDGSTGPGCPMAYYGHGATGRFNLIDRCIFESGKTTASAFYTRQSTIKNTVVVQRGSGAANITYSEFETYMYNCTLVCPSDKSVTSGIRVEYGTGTLQNCAVFGATADTAVVSGSISATTCATDDASPTSGFTTMTYSACFENTSDGTHDYRLKSGSPLLDVGTTDVTNAPTDIVGTSRPQGSAYDIGAWEYFVASGPPLWYAEARVVRRRGV